MANRFRLMRGDLTREQADQEEMLVRNSLKELTGTHWSEFLAEWPEPNPLL